MFEVFEHTADVGLRIEAPDLPGLFAEAARGLVALIVENPEAVRATVSREVAVAEADPAYLLRDWLAELLRLFETEQILLSRFDVHVEDNAVRATVAGERLDRRRHRPAHEVKAVTYHGLSVERGESGWRAEVILDI